MSTVLEVETAEADLTPERQFEHIQRLDRQCASLYEMFTKLSDRLDTLEKSNERNVPCVQANG